MLASVVINVASSNVDQMYEYEVPCDMAPYINIGARVKVEFGNGNRLVMGYVLETYEERKFKGEIRPIIELLDLKPIITPLQLKLAEYLKDDTICPLIRILNLMIPDAMKLKTYKYLIVKDSSKLDATLVDVFNGNEIIEVNKSLDGYHNKILREIKNGNIEVSYETKQTVKYKYITKYAVNMNMYYNYLNTLRNSLKIEFLNQYKDSIMLSENEILDNYEISVYMLKDLVKKGFLDVKKERTLRIKQHNIPINNEVYLENNELIDATVKKFLDESTIPYLYIPSSNKEKDDVILSLINQMVGNSKNVVILCADILSSVKYASFIRKQLGLRVACINSRVSSGEYLDYYTEILNDNYQVIVTTPKGAFLPYQNVGLYFMLDEESDNYYNDQSPRYDLHKAIYFLSYTTKAKFIMESISPAVSDYCYALKGVYKIVDNSSVTKNTNVEVINMLDELKQGNNTYLSRRLKNALIRTKQNNLQSLLIVNNKSFSNYVLCPSCGEVPKCPNCDISLYYNEKKSILLCPACGYRKDFLDRCEKCFNTSLRFGGIGIESVNELIENNFENYKTLCIVDNSNFEEFSYQMSLIEDQKVDVIITTETYARSIVNSHLGMVGIINFDSVLKTPSYDAESRAYNLLVYAASHLKDDNYKLFVQTTHIDSSALVNFIIGDYKAFMKTEIMNRKLMHNEPFYHVNRIIIKTPYNEMFSVANNIKKVLKELCDKLYVIGPTYSKQYGGGVLIVKHNYSKINDVYKAVYERYQNSQTVIIFDKYPRKL